MYKRFRLRASGKPSLLLYAVVLGLSSANCLLDPESKPKPSPLYDLTAAINRPSFTSLLCLQLSLYCNTHRPSSYNREYKGLVRDMPYFLRQHKAGVMLPDFQRCLTVTQRFLRLPSSCQPVQRAEPFLMPSSSRLRTSQWDGSGRE